MIFDQIIHWVSYNETERAPLIADLLKCIQLELIEEQANYTIIL